MSLAAFLIEKNAKYSAKRNTFLYNPTVIMTHAGNEMIQAQNEIGQAWNVMDLF